MIEMSLKSRLKLMMTGKNLQIYPSGSNMHVYITLWIIAAYLPAAHLGATKQLLQLENMIEVMIPGSSPLLQFGDYGCFCGMGGQGTPVDQLDQCCFFHDACYHQAKHLESCSEFDSPYTSRYDYSWDEPTKQITCLDSNNACAMFICECDKCAAECFSKAPYNSSNVNLPSRMCSSAPREKSSFITSVTTLSFALSICLLTF